MRLQLAVSHFPMCFRGNECYIIKTKPVKMNILTSQQWNPFVEIPCRTPVWRDAATDFYCEVFDSLDWPFRMIESSVERLADAADSDREIGRIVTDGTGAPAGNEEPTRLFGNGSSAGSQFSIDSLHFGK